MAHSSKIGIVNSNSFAKYPNELNGKPFRNWNGPCTRTERTWIAVAGVFVQIRSNVVVLDCVISVLAAARLQVATGISSRNLRLSFLTINVVWLTTAFQRWRRWKSSAVLTHDRRTRAPSSYVTHVSAYEHRMRPRDGSKPALVIYQ